MIHVPFDPAAVPSELLKLWGLEKPLAALAFALGIPKKPKKSRNSKNSKKSFDFTAYACPECKAALLKLFHGKCAYCEAPIVVVASGDIEHFRPKTFVKPPNGKKVCGYYWLAGEMKNLLLSCSNCNSRKGHEQPGASGKVMSGKGNEFPLADESKRATREGEEAREFPLLINPYLDRPEDYLSFNADGQVAARPLRGRARQKAAESIRIYGLNREPLVRSREDHSKSVLGNIRHVLRFYDRVKAGESGFRGDLSDDWRDLCDRLDKSKPYLATTRRLISELIAPRVRKEIESLTGITMPVESRMRLKRRK